MSSVLPKEFFYCYYLCEGDTMRVVKNINNNVSLCIDSQGREVVAFGKGIGFHKPPYEIPLIKIERTFYDINPDYLTVIAEIPEETIKVAIEIVDYANGKTERSYASNLILTLADHIHFAIKRKQNEINIKLPLFYEVNQLYPDEMKLGAYALKRMNAVLNADLPREEAASVALHFVHYNAQEKENSGNSISAVEKCAGIIEKQMKVTVDKTGFHYLRFVTHVYYLLDRARKHENVSSDNGKMFTAMRDEYPEIYQCALQLKTALNVDFNDEETLYLMLHINRLCIREDCDLT